MNKYLESLYSTSKYSENTDGWLPIEDIAKARSIEYLLRKAGAVEDVQSVLDVGCGTGGILTIIKSKLGDECIALGIDRSKIAIDLANSSKAKNIEFLNIDLFEVSQQFDLTILSHVLEHVMDWDGLLKQLSIVTKKYLYINVPLEVNILTVLRGNTLFDTYRKYGHVHFFDEKYIKTYLMDCGFGILASSYGEEFKVQNSTFRGKLARFPRSFLGFFSKSLAARLLGGYSLTLLCTPP